MSLLVVGSVAFDSLKTPYGQADEVLGGSASYFSVAASYFAPVNMLAVVGEDFGDDQMQIFKNRPIDTQGLERAAGRTFRWRGEYSGDMNEARTLETQLNVFEHFQPKIPSTYLTSEFVFLGNIHPRLQLHVRRQLPGAKLVACDTMNYWINGALDDLKDTLAAVDMVILNETEAQLLTGFRHVKRAAAALRALGPRTVVVKRGEYGSCLFQNDSIFFAPGYPLEEVLDPTGAGDTFAGGFMGYLARMNDLSPTNLRRALVYGSVMASFAVERFGLEGLLSLAWSDIESRFNEFKEMTHFDV
jgi:sugar/nucleoside kinase (ribokinase family)